MTLDNSTKSMVNLEKNVAKCSFWDTYYSVSGGATRSASEESLTQSIEEDAAESQGCTKIGGADTSCLTDNHGCVSTQTYCCS